MKKLISFIFVFVFLIFVIKECDSNSEKNDNADPYLEYIRNKKIEAYVASESIVEKVLKAPSTADFAGYSNSRVIRTQEGYFSVYSYVDAQNTFGAQIRSNYILTLKPTGGGWDIVELIFDGKQLK